MTKEEYAAMCHRGYGETGGGTVDGLLTVERVDGTGADVVLLPSGEKRRLTTDQVCALSVLMGKVAYSIGFIGADTPNAGGQRP
jgi:hypothetical protein